MIEDIIKLLRPKQYIKNLFVFLPIFFGGYVTEITYWTTTMWLFISFCFASSSIYCLNDIVDAKNDQSHPIKKNRPIASGSISKLTASVIMVLCASISILFLYIGKINSLSSSIVFAYLILNILYCFWLKNISIADVFCIAFGFVLRVVAGGTASDIWISPWIVLMTFLLTLLLATSKRRYDVILYTQDKVVSRKKVDHYSLDFLNIAMSIEASIAIVCYIIYTLSPDVSIRMQSDYIYITSFFVIAGILRYLQQIIVRSEQQCDPTAILVKDRFIQICLAGWICCFVIFIYL